MNTRILKEATMRDVPVYGEWAHTLVRSSHGICPSGSAIFYRISVGTVNWTGRGGEEKRACTVFMQYGDSADWNEASRDEIALKMPPHILNEDLDQVLRAIHDLQN